MWNDAAKLFFYMFIFYITLFVTAGLAGALIGKYFS